MGWAGGLGWAGLAHFRVWSYIVVKTRAPHLRRSGAESPGAPLEALAPIRATHPFARLPADASMATFASPGNQGGIRVAKRPFWVSRTGVSV